MGVKEEHYKQIIKYWNLQIKYLSSISRNGLQILSKILKILQKKKCKNILEIGCGLARDTLVIAQKNKKCKITCIDIVPMIIKKAKERIKEEKLEKWISFILGNIQNIKLKKNFFDGVIAKSVLHHLFSKNDIILACKNIYRSLKPKGVFILVENWANPNPSKYENLVFQISQKARKFKGIKEIFLKRDEYLRILKKIGFRDIKCTFINQDINIDRYALNKTLKVDVDKIKSTFPKGKVRNLFIVAHK